MDDFPQRRATDLPPDAPWWMRWLEANISEAWRWASMRWTVGCGILVELYAQYPEQVNNWVKEWLPVSWWPHIVSSAFLLTAILRIVNFKPKSREQS